GLYLVEDEQQSVAVAGLTQPPQRLRRHVAPAPLALHRLDQDGCRVRADEPLGGIDVVEGDLIEALGLRAEAFQILLLAACRDGRQGAAVKGTLEGNGAEPLGPPGGIMVAARRL